MSRSYVLFYWLKFNLALGTQTNSGQMVCRRNGPDFKELEFGFLILFLGLDGFRFGVMGDTWLLWA